MKTFRERLLDKVARTEGLEARTTLAVFAMSDLYPDKEYDGMIADLYEVLRSVDVETEEPDDLPKDNMNEDADAYEDIIANLYDWMEMDE